tara:strand:- start:734 stop:1072 length:339 start_codon:yes stop_codon:yes gene_type:complete
MDQVFNNYSNIPNQIIFSFNDEIANGMPVVNPERKVFNVTPTNISNPYNERNFAKRHHPFLSPSNASTAEAFFKARMTFSPVFIHDEAATKYALISALPIASSEIKKSIRFV